jgi:3D (Asp-Asp-Asp) domain-containing protein
MWSAMTHAAPADGFIRRIVSYSPKTAGAAPATPVLKQALPTRSTYAVAAGLVSPITRGHDTASSPASQAHHILAIPALSRVRQSPDARTTHAHIPSVRGVGLRDFTGTITQMAQAALHEGPPERVRGLGIHPVSHRSQHLSLLSLERVLDRQTFAAITAVSIARSHGEPAEDRALITQRPPIADGLKMVGVHPAATRYLHAANTPAHATASQSGDARASLTQPAKSNQSTGSPATWTAATMPGGNASLYWITGYTWTGARTATGTYPHWGTVAVDPTVIPLGSTVYIQGLGVFHAEDTGGGVVGQHVDVYVDSVAEAYQLTGYRLVSFIPPSG